VDTVESVLKPTQQKFLTGMLEGKPFSDLCRDLEMTKANGALLIKQLKDLGLVSMEPSRRHKRATIDPGKSGAVIWWDQQQEEKLDPRKPGPARWWVFATPIPRYERADVKPDRWAVVVTSPWEQFAFTLSDRERVSFNQVEKILAGTASADHIPASPNAEVWSDTVRTVTEMVADAMGIQAVLPERFIRMEEEDDGGDEDAARAGG
jgi:hypothetical protein